ncbi:MAG: hypothetical protein RSE55_03500 [Lachnospiraceae bacterium]
MKILGIIFLVFFVAGIMGANMNKAGTTDKISIMSDYFFSRYEYASVNQKDLMIYIFYQRLPIFASLLVFGLTSYRMTFFGCAVGWYGFSVGYFHAISVMRYGIKGLLLTGGLLFPQCVLYFFVFWYLIKVMLQKNKKEKIQTTMAIGILFALYIVGILVENYINPYLLYQIIKFL